ncbi:MAG: hypothetical protein ACK4N1_10260 [Pseudorhizobium sp.]
MAAVGDDHHKACRVDRGFNAAQKLGKKGCEVWNDNPNGMAALRPALKRTAPML